MFVKKIMDVEHSFLFGLKGEIFVWLWIEILNFELTQFRMVENGEKYIHGN